jgi:predicted nucleic acid-binding Zn ribbon protein
LNARQQVLAQWRGRDWVSAEKTAQQRSRPASQVMNAVLGRLNIDRKRTESEVMKVWTNLIDPQVVAHAQPTRLVKGTLFISVDNSVWLSELVRFRQKEILQRLQSSFGSDFIKRLSFRAG